MEKKTQLFGRYTARQLSIVICQLSITIATLLPAACTNDADGGHPGTALTYTVAAPPAWGDAPRRGFDAYTRHAIDPSNGHITWHTGDVVYLSIGFINSAGDEISRHQTTLTRGSTDWTPDKTLAWPLTAASAQVSASYIGTALPGEAIVNQPIYHVTAGFAAGEAIEINFTSHNTACLAISGLDPADEVTLTAPDRVQTWMLADDYTLRPVTTTVTPTSTADADGRLLIFASIIDSDSDFTIDIARGSTAIATGLDLDLPAKDGNGAPIDYNGKIIPVRVNIGLPGVGGL